MVYKALFNIDLLHAYFLDQGEKKYHANNANDELSEEEKQDSLRSYNLFDFMEVIPNKKTRSIAKNHRILIRNHSKGIRVLTSSLQVNSEEGNDVVVRYSPVINLSNDVVFTFFIKAKDRFFLNYSDVTEKTNNKLYYLSNLSSSATNVFDSNSSIEKWEDFVITERESRKLVYELEKEQEFDTNTPKLVTISSIDESLIESIEDKVDNDTALTDDETEIFNYLNTSVKQLKNSGVIGVFQIKVSGDDNSNLTELVDTEDEQTGNFDIEKQCLLKDTVDFQIYIENKKTFWRYRQRSENQIMVTKQEHPLTKNGKVEIEKTDVTPQPSGNLFFPNPTIDSVTKEEQDYYSEIFI
ncbi:hypothetical protein EV195_107196 [Tenacibaculum skagerrakense]|uniref:Uncharacterized protein n=1 Tax=Tenacibaculum skagerrakense TaxID=186571 RepID=A0A4R2NQE1_9FLAO|nr:hypothetical protein [Tenacibaculum skagerrakense]TCP24030.1 hypothetical protein EV195_107196 [Tenacibaculum skagerrakense]